MSFNSTGAVRAIAEGVGLATLPAYPVAIGIAVVRYRLYDLDRLISRTIGYALVTLVLLATYGVLVVGLQWLLGDLVGGNTVAVALSTLVAAALFQPLRRRIQRIVDRRFDRARFDAQTLTRLFDCGCATSSPSRPWSAISSGPSATPCDRPTVRCRSASGAPTTEPIVRNHVVTSGVDDVAMSRFPRRSAVLVTALLVLLGACAPQTPPDDPDAPSGSPTAAGPQPVIVDADMDASDLVAVMVLLQDPMVDVRAILIDGTGLVHCAGGRRVTRYLLEELGRAEIPFACGREDGGADARPFPDDWRAVADDAYGLDIPPQIQSGLPPEAATLLTDAVAASPSPPLVIALGPLTNLEDAFAADPTLPGRLAGVHAMLGTIDAPGNVMVDGLDGADRYEWNAFADPSAVAAVLATDVPVSLIPLDATADVPVPADLPDRLAATPDAGAANLASELLSRFPARMAADAGQQLWDELAALTVSQPDLVTWAEATVIADERGGLRPEADGRPIRYATSADRPRVEDALVATLASGGPRATPFAIAGTLAVTWDGTTCAMTAPSRPGLYEVTYQGKPGSPGGVLVAGVAAPRQWSDLTTFLSGIDLSTEVEEPAWLLQGGQIWDESGAGRPIGTTAMLGPGTWGPVCVQGTWPDLTFTPGAGRAVGG